MKFWNQFREAVIKHFNQSLSSYFAGQLLKYALIVHLGLGLGNIIMSKPFKLTEDSLFIYFFLTIYFAIDKLLKKIETDSVKRDIALLDKIQELIKKQWPKS